MVTGGTSKACLYHRDGRHVEEGDGKTEKNDMKCCPLDRILPLHTQTHSSSNYVQNIKPVKNYNTDQEEATQLPLAEELWGIDGFLEMEWHFSLRVWPLVGYSCSNR